MLDQLNPAAQTLVAHGGLAVFGGVVHALDAQRKGKAKNLVDVAILAIMSSFSGVIFALLATYFFDSPYLTLAAAGAGGYLGVEGLAAIAERLRDIITKKTP